MGVSLHYRGNINQLDRLPVLCEELADIAGSMGWKAERLDDNWEEPSDARLETTGESAEIRGSLGLKGVEILPGEECEPLSFCFDREGKLWSPVIRVLALDGALTPDQAWVSVKTQSSSPRTHAWVVGLLRYVKKHYIADLEVSDEGGYWETGDMDALRTKMRFLEDTIHELCDGLSSVRVEDIAGLSAEEIASKIEGLLDDEAIDREQESDESRED
jgi:hypothetical protein